MYTGLLHLHSLLRWVIFVLLLWAVIKSLMGMTGNKPFTNGDKKLGLFLMIAAHTTLLVGLYQWFASPIWGLHDIQSSGMKAVMGDKLHRFWAVEHFAGMLIGIVLITIGRGSAKKNISDVAKHKRSFWFYFIAFVIIVASIPWPFREIIGRPWFPGMQ